MTIAYLHGQASACRPPIASRVAAVGSTRGRGTSRRTTVRVCGEVDAANAKEFAVAVYEAIPPAARSVTLDLSDLDFIAVDGIAALHAINAHLTRRRRDVARGAQPGGEPHPRPVRPGGPDPAVDARTGPRRHRLNR